MAMIGKVRRMRFRQNKPVRESSRATSLSRATLMHPCFRASESKWAQQSPGKSVRTLAWQPSTKGIEWIRGRLTDPQGSTRS